MWHLVEKKNHLALHGIFHSKENAMEHLTKVIPDYVAKSYFMDKTLTADSFEIVSAPRKESKNMYKKIDIYLRKFMTNHWQYECSTTWSKTCQQAKSTFCKTYGLDSSQVKANFSTK